MAGATISGPTWGGPGSTLEFPWPFKGRDRIGEMNGRPLAAGPHWSGQGHKWKLLVEKRRPVR